MLEASKTVTLPRVIFEPSSPFVEKPIIEREPIPVVEEGPRPIFLELLGAPAVLVERMEKREELDRLILGSIGTILLCLAFYATISLSWAGPLRVLRGTAFVSLSTLLALASAFGPVYAASLLLAARIPLARLIGVILSSAATGSLILAACAPVPFFLHRLDRAWAGPLSMLIAFLISALVSGARIHTTMHALAEKSCPVMTPDARHRVGVLARVSWMVVGFTLALALWGFDALT
jgi:hypothetical protein